MADNTELLARAAFWLSRCELKSSELHPASNIQEHFEDAVQEILAAVNPPQDDHDRAESRAVPFDCGYEVWEPWMDEQYG